MIENNTFHGVITQRYGELIILKKERTRNDGTAKVMITRLY